MAPVERPMGVTLGSIYLIVMGVLTSLLGGCAAIGGAAFGQLGAGTDASGPFGALGALLAGLGIVILVLGIVGIVAGAGALSGRGWARWTGIILSAIFAVLLILGGVSSLGAQNGMTSALVSLVLGVLYALTAWAFVQATAFFAARR
ncbi:MAG TPA: hypothetical protein VH741_04815 [Candidatus Limnocylindrales bacterium]|jgi:hypothetical protein